MGKKKVKNKLLIKLGIINKNMRKSSSEVIICSRLLVNSGKHYTFVHSHTYTHINK